MEIMKRIMMKQRCLLNFHKICQTFSTNVLLQGEVREMQCNLLGGSHCDPVSALPVVGVIIGEVWRSKCTRFFCIIFQAYCEKKQATREKIKNIKNIMLHFIHKTFSNTYLINLCQFTCLLKRLFWKVQRIISFQNEVLKSQRQNNF